MPFFGHEQAHWESKYVIEPSGYRIHPATAHWSSICMNFSIVTSSTVRNTSSLDLLSESLGTTCSGTSPSIILGALFFNLTSIPCFARLSFTISKPCSIHFPISPETFAVAIFSVRSISKVLRPASVTKRASASLGFLSSPGLAKGSPSDAAKGEMAKAQVRSGKKRFFIFCRTPSLAAGRLGCGWCETVVLMPVGYGDLFGLLFCFRRRLRISERILPRWQDHISLVVPILNSENYISLPQKCAEMLKNLAG